MDKFKITFFAILGSLGTMCAQPVPAVEENIPYLVTFGGQSDKSWGDDDFSQVFFFVVPQVHMQGSVYVRVFDPDCGGLLDEKKAEFNTVTTFSVYGGKESYSHKDARKNEPGGNYKSGVMLESKKFKADEKYDQAWYSFGPINPKEGEFVPEFGGYVFKVIAEGGSGDDGNLYRYFLSTSGSENRPVEGANWFTYEYTFRLSDAQADVSHLYPYIDKNVISVKISDFDHDDDGMIKIISVATKGAVNGVSGDNGKTVFEHKVLEQERGSSLDIQFIKSKTAIVRNNNITLFITNQYGEMLPFFVAPIGGIPKYKYVIGVKQKAAR